METVGGLKFPRYVLILPQYKPDVQQPCTNSPHLLISKCPLFFVGLSFTRGYSPIYVATTAGTL